MNLLRRRITLNLVVVLVLLFASAAFAYVLFSPRRTWRNTLYYTVDNRGISSIADGDGGVSRTVSAITSSSAWNGAGAFAGTLVAAGAGSVSSWALGDGTPMLNFQDPPNACTGNCLAATFINYYTGSRITDADIVTNSTGFSWTSQGEDPNGVGCNGEFYIEGVQVHETGHGLGIDHTSVSGATMYPFVNSCSNAPATTESDDNAAAQDLYNCKFYGYVCDPRYVSPSGKCCGGTSCYSPYPGVPQYCL